MPAQRVAPVPDDVNDEEAAFGPLAAVVLEAVHRLDVRLGDIVAVAGLGVVGLIAAELLELSGIRVVALDDDPDRLALARHGRPALACDTASGSALAAVATLTAGRGCDALIVCRTVAPAKVLASLVRPGGRVRLLVFGAETLSVHHLEALMAESRSLSKGVSGLPISGWSSQRWLKEAVHRMTRGRDHRLAVEYFITHRFAMDEVGEARRLLDQGGLPVLAVVLQKSGRAARASVPRTWWSA